MAGISGTSSGSKGALELMLGRLHHRGPESKWIHLGKRVALGCCVLPSEAHHSGRTHSQMANTVVVIDGHLYSEDGVQLPEADLLVSLYSRFGPRFVERLDGDFALCLATDSELIVARDSVGLRPLFYGFKDGALYFASEAKALCPVADDIKEFPPGYVYTSSEGFRRYTPQVDAVPGFDSPEQAAKVLARLVEEAVQKRMADNAVEGVLLSGGLDSSIIACVAKECKPDIKAFTVSVEGGEDLPLARDMARYLGIEHHVHMYTESDVIEVLSRVIYHLESFEEDNVHGAVANFFASRLAARHTKCVLTGEGADEFLGGYHEQLRRAKDEKEVARLIDKLIAVAYNTGLQRLDRMMAVHSLEFRTPFLDQRVTNFCLKVPTSWKVHGAERIGKWLLRRAFSERLPKHIAWQTKRPFASGAGSSKFMRALALKQVSDEEFMAYQETEEGLRLHSAEELYYYRIFKENFAHPALPHLVAKWDPFKHDFRS